jgi:N-acetylglucosaminyl-diphospho-decaprenol L-rhamnosyltransferase
VDPKASRERAQRVEPDVRVSAIVVTRHTGQPLELCLRSLMGEPWIDELIVVDNANPAAVSSALRALQADRRDVVLLQGHGDVGRAAGLNLGAAKARGRWLLFLDPTVVVQRGAVERMVAAGGGARSPWIIGGRLTDTDGREQGGARGGALTAWAAASIALGLPGTQSPPAKRLGRKVPPDSLMAGQDPIRVAAVSGALMLIPRSDFSELGAFDEGYETDGQDLDLCRRAVEAGGAVLLQPAASGVWFSAARKAAKGRREAQGLARFAVKSARTPAQHMFGVFARPILGVFLFWRGLVRRLPPASAEGS